MDYNPMDRNGRQMIEDLKRTRPDVSITVIRTEDPYTAWDGDEPIDTDIYTCYDHEVRATTIRDGETITGSNYLGGSWYDLTDDSADNQECIAEISGYLPQMIDEALEELDANLGELKCEICGEPAGAGGALCPVHAKEAGIE